MIEVEASSSSDGQGQDSLPLHAVLDSTTQPIRVTLLINNKELVMELDTGAATSLISEATYHKLFPDIYLHRSSPVFLKTYTGQELVVVGEAEVDVKYEQQTAHLPLLVVKGDGPSLLGRNWLKVIRLNWSEINAVARHQRGSLDFLLEKY